MRLWSVHPRHLDAKGLVACWREALLAQAVLHGRTRGYTRHPQLQRFRAHPTPEDAVAVYLCGIADEADRRGYRFDRGRILVAEPDAEQITVTTGQLALEWAHLRAKLAVSDPQGLKRWEQTSLPDPHPLLRVIDGPVEPWERA